MLTIDPAGCPSLVCGKCREPIQVDLALAVKFSDLSSVQFACLDCAEKLKEQFPGLNFVLARDYFEALLAPGRPKRVLPPRT